MEMKYAKLNQIREDQKETYSDGYWKMSKHNYKLLYREYLEDNPDAEIQIVGELLGGYEIKFDNELGETIKFCREGEDGQENLVFKKEIKDL